MAHAGHQSNEGQTPLRYRVIVRLGALRDIDRIHAFIARTHPLNAARYVDRIGEAIAHLESLPMAWPEMRLRKLRGVRHRIVGSHRLIFVVRDLDATVHVLRVFDARAVVAREVRRALESDLIDLD